MKKILIFFTALVLATLVFAGFYFSGKREFNKADWNHRLSEDCYDRRESMLDDLLTNHRLKGMNIVQLRELLGMNDLGVVEYDHKLTIQMNIITDYGWDIDPVYTKNLVVHLNRDSVVTSFEVREYHSK